MIQNILYFKNIFQNVCKSILNIFGNVKFIKENVKL